jgi:hypothetical protein
MLGGGRTGGADLVRLVATLAVVVVGRDGGKEWRNACNSPK